LAEAVPQLEAFLISDADAEEAVAEMLRAVKQVEALPPGNYSADMMSLIKEIRDKLDAPNKPAAAKLKATLPILPPFISYEMELDSESSVVSAWRRLRSLFRRKA
jgi:hypothetical protein